MKKKIQINEFQVSREMKNKTKKKILLIIVILENQLQINNKR